MNYISGNSAKDYFIQIKKLKNDATYMKILAQEHITIVEQLIQLQNKTINDMTNDMAHFESKINSFYDSVKAVEWAQYFSMINEIAAGIYEHHKSMTNEIMRLISQTLKGEISRHIPILQLKQNLYDIH